MALALVGALIAAPAAEGRSQPPVVLIVFDELPTDSIVGADGQIDSARFPGFAALAATSTWFRNSHTVSDTTLSSVPSILTSTPPRRHERFKLTYKDYRHSLFTLLGARGYRISAIDADTRICPPRYCRYPEPFGNKALSPVRERVAELDAFLRSLKPTKRPRFTYLHSLLPHVPWHLTPDGHIRDPGPPEKAARILAGPWGYSDPFVTTQNEQRHLLQVGYVDTVVRSLIARLRKKGLFDRSLIVITADHGVSFELGAKNRRAVRRDGRNVDEIGLVPLFVKPPGQKRGRVSSAWVRGTDVLPTIAGALGLRLPWRPTGASAYSRSVAARRHLVTSSPDIGYTVRVRGSVVERRRRANLARRRRLFGAGGWESVFLIGPNRHLLGMSPAQLPSAPAAGVSAEFDQPSDLGNIDPSARTIPTWTVGLLRGGDVGPGTRRDLALAVNGKIRAVGRSVRLDGVPKEFFSLIFDHRHLLRGRNMIQLYEVRRSGTGLALAALGGR